VDQETNKLDSIRLEAALDHLIIQKGTLTVMATFHECCQTMFTPVNSVKALFAKKAAVPVVGNNTLSRAGAPLFLDPTLGSQSPAMGTLTKKPSLVTPNELEKGKLVETLETVPSENEESSTTANTGTLKKMNVIGEQKPIINYDIDDIDDEFVRGTTAKSLHRNLSEIDISRQNNKSYYLAVDKAVEEFNIKANLLTPEQIAKITTKK